ncbi:unnamed protein product [Musa acuminata subsp. malaccensis]|uniref:(wild Malaysian banana) hypothetical protein n=1 Tax=Musa acuminata subsp. malaccensis TaxID=214687 RepID=A0A804ILK1_MUSAM|nr:PREDICTED: uncharacterized protein LOC108952497 [Musa acuminata subsp. malaccensis]CAG1841337.1 unnamed protein product [Musa acuminata subsp. malaccensis]
MFFQIDKDALESMSPFSSSFSHSTYTRSDAMDPFLLLFQCSHVLILFYHSKSYKVPSIFPTITVTKQTPRMKLNLLLCFLLLFLRANWGVPTTTSHGAKDQPLQGLNVTVEPRSGGNSGGEKMEFDGVKRVEYSRKSSSGGKGGGRTGGGGSQSLHQPRPQKSSSPTMQQPFGFFSLLLYLYLA